MSIYSSSTSWGCPATNQSPINLSQSSAKPCDLLCELVMDDVMIPSANLMVSDEGLILQSTSGLGSCKYNGEGYTCNVILVNHPSHHTIENIQADAEVIAIFTNPTGKYLCVSALARVNSAQSTATQFFNAFVPYADPTQKYTTVNLGENWGVFMMVPPEGSYYVYEGSMVFPTCQPAQWVVFKSMINIDPNEFAYLVKNVTPGSRPIQPLGDREVFFNDITKLPGAPQAPDGKTYMRCKRVAKKGDDVKSVSKPDVKGKSSELGGNQGTISATLTTVSNFAKKQVKANGYIGIIDWILLILSVVLGFYYGSSMSARTIGMFLPRISQSIARFIRGLFSKPAPQ
jgi:carbonic anhydrase